MISGTSWYEFITTLHQNSATETNLKNTYPEDGSNKQTFTYPLVQGLNRIILSKHPATEFMIGIDHGRERVIELCLREWQLELVVMIIAYFRCSVFDIQALEFDVGGDSWETLDKKTLHAKCEMFRNVHFNKFSQINDRFCEKKTSFFKMLPKDLPGDLKKTIFIYCQSDDECYRYIPSDILQLKGGVWKPTYNITNLKIVAKYPCLLEYKKFTEYPESWDDSTVSADRKISLMSINPIVEIGSFQRRQIGRFQSHEIGRFQSHEIGRFQSHHVRYRLPSIKSVQMYRLVGPI